MTIKIHFLDNKGNLHTYETKIKSYVELPILIKEEITDKYENSKLLLITFL